MGERSRGHGQSGIMRLCMTIDRIMGVTFDIVVLAAGKGTRMRSDYPKVLQPVAGRPMLAHVLDVARSLGPVRLCVVYGHGGELVPQALAAPDVTWVRQDRQLGTGHAVLQALPHCATGGLTLVLYGDVPLLRSETLRALLAQAGPDRLALLTVELADPTGYGRIVRDSAGHIERIVEERDADASIRSIREINTGVLVAPTEKLADWLPRIGCSNHQGEYYLTDIVAMAATERLDIVACQPAEAQETLGVNDRAQQAEVERALQWRAAQQQMACGVTLLDPARFDVRGTLRCGRDVVIDAGCLFVGTVELGDRVHVGPHCVLEDVRVASDVRIAAFSHLHGAQVGAGAQVGPYARLRPGTRLDEAVHIGNFVEVKNSTVGAHSKINHLSYVGDSSVGKRVNIGAGTITCNYDGANKHRTVIGDDVFVGSGTELVAPVELGEGATIGAGSTITQYAPAGELTLARERQVTRPGWKRPVKQAKGS